VAFKGLVGNPNVLINPKTEMDMSIDIPRRLPLLLVTDNVLLPGSSMRIPVRSIRKYVGIIVNYFTYFVD
jgi:hypothetical protein